jgi:hypothetical protein
VSDEPAARIWIGTLRATGPESIRTAAWSEPAAEPVRDFAHASAAAAGVRAAAPAGSAAASVRAASVWAASAGPAAEPVRIFAHASAAAAGVRAAAAPAVPPSTAAAHPGLRDPRPGGRPRDTAVWGVADSSTAVDAGLWFVADSSTAVDAGLWFVADSSTSDADVWVVADSSSAARVWVFAHASSAVDARVWAHACVAGARIRLWSPFPVRLSDASAANTELRGGADIWAHAHARAAGVLVRSRRLPARAAEEEVEGRPGHRCRCGRARAACRRRIPRLAGAQEA